MQRQLTWKALQYFVLLLDWTCPARLFVHFCSYFILVIRIQQEANSVFKLVIVACIPQKDFMWKTWKVNISCDFHLIWMNWNLMRPNLCIDKTQRILNLKVIIIFDIKNHVLVHFFTEIIRSMKLPLSCIMNFISVKHLK